MKNRDWRKNPFLKEAKKTTLKEYLQCAKALFWIGVICFPFIPLLIIPLLKTDEVFYFVMMLFAILGDLLIIGLSVGNWGRYSKFFPLNSLKEFEVSLNSENDIFQYGRFVDDKGTLRFTLC